MAYTDPMTYGSLPDGLGGPSEERESNAHHSSASRVSEADNSNASKPGKRGKKPFHIPEEVERGLVRLINSTDISFDKVAQAVEEEGGPR